MWQLTVLPQYSIDRAPWPLGQGDSPWAERLACIPCNLGVWSSKPVQVLCSLPHTHNLVSRAANVLTVQNFVLTPNEVKGVQEEAGELGRCALA